MKYTYTNEKLSPILSRSTVQELSLKQLFLSERIPFIFQKEFSFSNRSYLVDFFIGNLLLLECSFTLSSHYDNVLRQKAILLDAKTAYIKRFFSYPMWVLFETSHPISDKFFTTLCRLMPSVDQFFTSRNELLEILPMIIENNHQTEAISSSIYPLIDNSSLEKTFHDHHDSRKTPSTRFGTKDTPINSLSSSNHHFVNLQKHPSPNFRNRAQVIFSQNLNKHSTEGFSNFRVSNNFLEDNLL